MKHSKIFTAVEIEAPAHVAYDYWLRFESFPSFMEGVKDVIRIDESAWRWCFEIGMERRQWVARITELVPGRRLAWTSIAGTTNFGVVTFHPLSDHHCRVAVQIDYDVGGFVERVGDSLGLLEQMVLTNLGHFRLFVETGERARGGAREAENAEGKDRNAPPRRPGARPVMHLQRGEPSRPDTGQGSEKT